MFTTTAFRFSFKVCSKSSRNILLPICNLQTWFPTSQQLPLFHSLSTSVSIPSWTERHFTCSSSSSEMVWTRVVSLGWVQVVRFAQEPSRSNCVCSCTPTQQTHHIFLFCRRKHNPQGISLLPIWKLLAIYMLAGKTLPLSLTLHNPRGSDCTAVRQI